MEEGKDMGRRAGDVDYSQRELRHFFSEFKEQLAETRQETKEKLSAIHAEVKENVAQAKLTNGRVNVLEKDRDQMEGAMKVIKIVLVPIFLAVLYTFIK